MKQESELGRLETFVSSLMARYNALVKENERLSQDVQERDETIDDLRASLAQLESERTEISSRVSGIILQIEEWEKCGTGSAGSSSGDAPEGRVQGSLFSLGADAHGAADQD
jgi:FtsZ-binding cell division protein ZapB